MNATQFMDKQIMDLSNSQSSNNNTANDNNSNSNEFIGLTNPSEEEHRHHHIGGGGGGDSVKKEEIIPSYDFQRIRPIGTSPPRANLDSGNVTGGGFRSWPSADSRANSSPTRNYGSLEPCEPSKVISGKDINSADAALLSEIDQTMKKYADNLLHAVEGVNARLSQLETRTCQLENSVGDLKVAIGNNHGSTDGKMRQLENLLREVQTSVQMIRDKQDIMDAQLQVAKLQIPEVEQQPEIQNTVNVDSVQPAVSAPQQLPPVSNSQPPPTLSPSNAPPPPSSQQNPPQHVQVPNQYSLSQLPPVPQRDSYFPQPSQMPENASKQYQMPPPHQLQPASPPQPHPQQLQPIPPLQPLPQQQYQAPPQLQYSQPPPPPPQLPHPSLSALNPSQPQPPLGHQLEETPFIQSQNYPPGIHQLLSHPPTGAPPAQQYYGASPNMYEAQPSRPGPGFSEPQPSRPGPAFSEPQPSRPGPAFSEPQPNRTGPGFSGVYGPSSGHGESYPYSSSPSQYGSGSLMKPQQLPSPAMGQTAGTGYPQLPTARILPQALPTASSVGGGSGFAGTGNRVPIDDVIDRVTNMGFPRDQVRAAVRKLTESGQSVDLNVVLDKLMNGGEGQPPQGWFGR